MKRSGLCLLLCVCLSPAIFAAPGVTFETITIANASIGITATTINPAGRPQQNVCAGRLESADVRYRIDGTAPTDSIGVLLSSGDTITIVGADTAQTIRFIRTAAVSATLSLHCWRE
jgi:hypothetical protein